MDVKPVFLPIDFQERHARLVKAGPKACLDAVEAFRSDDDVVVRLCLALRDLPGRLIRGQTAHRFSMESFTPLGRVGDSVVRYGLVGAFWRWDYGLAPDCRDATRFWEESGAACRLLLTFETVPVTHELTRLVRRTMVSCPHGPDRRRMASYWHAIRPVSGLIRRRILAQLAARAEGLDRGSNSVPRDGDNKGIPVIL